MENERNSFVKNFFTYLLKIIASLQDVIKIQDEQLRPKYALVDWVIKNGIGFCRIHVLGTNHINDYTPAEIVTDDAFINGFNKIDVRTITHLAHYEKEKPIAAISSINFVNNKIEIRETGKEVVSIPIDDNIEDIIDKFGKKDVFNLGRLLGEKDVKL